ncbi:MAG TPA: BMP family ABC transporter substrate-binding protein [Nakamurella sp.]|nr:BMP family ABC transporter substrate-binding protein [Nakamurella sp.]
MRRARSLKLIAGLMAGALALAACSSGSSSSSSSSASSAVAPSAASSSAASSGAASSGSGAASAAATMTGDPAAVKLGLAYDVGGRGDQSFNDLAAASLDKAKAAGVTIVGELTAAQGEPDSAKTDRLNQLIDSGATDIMGVGFAYAGALKEVAAANPEVNFAIVDDASLAAVPNVASLTFAEEQGSYLVGVAAGKKTKTNKVGFIGGVNTPLIQKFQAGYEAGVKAANPSATVTAKYITEPPDFAGFNSPQQGETIATGMYNDGIDIIYAAAGGSGAGVFKAAKATGNLGIGVDSDQYKSPTLADVKEVIMTSMLKQVDVATYNFITSAVNGDVLTGEHKYNLSNDGIGYATSGGQVDDIVTDLDKAKQEIIDGTITVPSTTS